MNIEIIDDEMPFANYWLGFNSALNMVIELVETFRIEGESV